MRTRWLAALCFVAGCASAPVRPAATPAVDLRAADARLLQGCYDCLIEARDAYARAAVGRYRPLVLPRLFEAELLVALREKEFAIDARAALARARALAAELPAAIDADRYVALVDAVPYESFGWPRAEAARFRLDHSTFASQVDQAITWLRSDVLSPAVAEYLARALDCGYGARPRNEQRVNFGGVDDTAVPLLRYRAAACAPGLAPPFERLLDGLPEFVDASYYLGVIGVAGLAEGGPDPRPFVNQIQRRLPDSPAVAFLAATMQQTLGNCAAALPLFDRLIALKPAHERGWLGRVTCLTALQQTTGAIAAATRMIEMSLDNRDEAYYWRARNYHGLGQLALARADSDTAKALRIKSDVLTLAGLIEHDQDDLDVAEADLKRAQQMDRGRNCFAAWLLGSVFVKRSGWGPAAASFDAARACYGDDATTRGLLLDNLEKNERLDPEYRRAQAAILRSQVEASRQQHYAAAFNAANFFYQSGDLDKARELLDIAELDPSLGAEVASLRPLVPKRPASPPPTEP